MRAEVHGGDSFLNVTWVSRSFLAQLRMPLAEVSNEMGMAKPQLL